jgi:hypothetical protein
MTGWATDTGRPEIRGPLNQRLDRWSAIAHKKTPVSASLIAALRSAANQIQVTVRYRKKARRLALRRFGSALIVAFSTEAVGRSRLDFAAENGDHVLKGFIKRGCTRHARPTYFSSASCRSQVLDQHEKRDGFGANAKLQVIAVLANPLIYEFPVGHVTILPRLPCGEEGRAMADSELSVRCLRATPAVSECGGRSNRRPTLAGCQKGHE